MSSTEPQPAEPKPERHPFQFSLRGLLWFTTVVAGLCASVACSRRLVGDSGFPTWLIIAFLFWPSLAALIVWICPVISFTGRLRIYAVMGVDVVLVFWGTNWQPASPGRDFFIAFMVTFVAAFLLWVPQGLVVFATMTCVRERCRSRQSHEAAAAPPPQNGTPPAGSTFGPAVE